MLRWTCNRVADIFSLVIEGVVMLINDEGEGGVYYFGGVL